MNPSRRQDRRGGAMDTRILIRNATVNPTFARSPFPQAPGRLARPRRALQNGQNASIVRRFTKEAALRILGTAFLSVALIPLCAPAFASEALPENGSAKLSAYQVCRPLAVVDMDRAGSASSTECNGIVKNLDSQKQPDNLTIHCLENTSARPDAYRYFGTCVQTDGDGDKLYMTYEGTKEGQVKWVGGTGKYKDVNGSGNLSVVVAPGNSSNLFLYTLNFDVTWTQKAK
jgi:hypothetical protein